MPDAADTIQESLQQQRIALQALIRFFQQELDYTTMVYTYWNAKDILGHLTFWHESFARNIDDLGKGRPPTPLRGKLSEVNQQSVETTAATPIPDLIQRLQKAQKTIEHHIFNEEIHLIPYKKGSRDYGRQEHLDLVQRHLQRHLKDLEKSFKHAQTKKQNRTPPAK